MTHKQISFAPIVLLVLFGIATRLIPHPANITAVGAVALFAGFYLPKKLAFLIPLSAMIISDLVIGLYSLPIMIAVYLGFAVSVLLGAWARSNEHRFTALGVSTLAGSIVFFFLTNTAVWAFGTLYPHTLSGLMTSYTMAIPFFRASLVGDLVFTTLLVGSTEAIPYILKPKILAQNSI
jgi:hypothetical protein